MLGIVRALVFGGWKVIVGVTGHDVGEQRDAMGRAINTATVHEDACGFAMMEGELHTPNDEIPLRMDHAGAWETSCMMYARGEKVALDALREQGLSDDLDEHLQMTGKYGIGGRNPPKHASAELGRKIIEGMGELIGQKAARWLAEGPDKEE